MNKTIVPILKQAEIVKNIINFIGDVVLLTDTKKNI